MARFYLEHAWIYVGDYGTDGRSNGNTEPAWLEAGQSLGLTRSYAVLRADAESAYQEFSGIEIPIKHEDRVYVSFDCGEGDRHRANLPRRDRAVLKRMLRTARQRAADNAESI